MADKLLLDCIVNSVLDAAFAEPEIPGILFQQDRVKEIAEETGRNLVRQRSAKAFAISLCALTVFRKLILGLTLTCLYPTMLIVAGSNADV